MAEIKNVPAIRFNGFSAEWSTTKFESLTKINQGLQIAISQRYTEKIEGSYFYITNEFLKEGSNSKYYILNPSQSVLCDVDDVLMTRTGNTGEVVTNISGAFHNNFFKIKYDYEKIEKNFLVTFLRLPKTQKVILASAGSSTIPDLNHSAFYNIEITFASLKEQTQIGSYFQHLDKLISLHQAKVNKLVKLKKAMLEKMFPKQGADVPEIRFKGFAGAWDEKSLGDEVADIVGGGTPNTFEPTYWNGDIDWYSPTEIGTKVFADGSVKKITELGLQNSSAKLLPANKTILFTSRAGIGDMAILRRIGATNQGFQSMVLKDGYDPYFIYSMGYIIKDYAIKYSSGSTFLEISGKILRRMVIKVPSLTEQEKIGTYFQNLDKTITLHQTELEKLNHLKKACLEKMFV